MQKSGFFTSNGGDRKYTSEWLARYIAGIISNGVYTTELTTTGNGDMSVNVAAGRAWINGYMYANDSPLRLTIGDADGTLHRIDRVALRLDMTNRQITTVLLPGEFATQPTATALTRDADIYELCLADVSVRAGTTAISNLQITDQRTDEALCGIVCGAVTQLSTREFLLQLEAGFIDWFDDIKGKLSEDVAGSLQNQITNLAYTKTFAAQDWTADGTITITPAEHGKTLVNGVVSVDAYMLMADGGYEKTWAAFETYAKVDANKNIVLHYPGAKTAGGGYAGKVVLVG